MMTQRITLYYFIVLLGVPAVVQCISIVGPRVLRPFNSYTVAVAGGSRTHSLYVAVEGQRANGEHYTQGREVQVQAASSRLIELEIGDPGPGQYALVARSTSGPLFSSSAPLVYQPRSFCVFVQTDKRVYQPGDTINFRVIALDKYLLPLSTTVDVTILDTGGSPIRQWAGVNLDRGILTEELLLAEEPALGEWTIKVEARGQAYSRRLLVADYVPPRFHMQIDMPKEILFKDGRFDINVTAKHFNGLPVRGELTISAYPVFFSNLLQPVVASPTRKVVDINGQTQVTFDLKTDLDLAEDTARPLVVEAVIEEKDTLIRQNVTSRILLLRAPYRLKVTAPDYFKPTLPYIVQIELLDSSGQLMDVNGDVTVERLWDDGSPANVSTVPLTKGTGAYSIVPDQAHVNSTLNLVVKYNEVTSRVVNVQRGAYSDGQFLALEVLTRNTGVGDEMRARITTTEPMDLVHYAVIGRGDILVAKTLELSPARRSVDVTVPVSAAMAPGCVLLAWYPRLDASRNDVLSAATYVPQRKLLQNKISISPVSSTGAGLKPNTLVELRVAGDGGAKVALLAAGSAAQLTGLAGRNGLGSGLDMHTIEREVESFSGLSHSVYKNEEHLPLKGTDLGGYTSADVFKNAGVVILTDGVIIKNNGEVGPTESPAESGTRAPQAGPYAFSRLPPPPSPRYYLTAPAQPTWMLANLTMGNDGEGAKEAWTPATPGEYSIGAFSVHPTLGLGLADPQMFVTSVPLSITAELPATLQRGETLAAVVILKTTLAVDTTVEVTFHNNDQHFEFEPLDNEVDSVKKIELYRRVSVTVPARGMASTAFLVSVIRAGPAIVLVEASGNGVSVSLSRTIDVKEGYEEQLWAWSLLDARRGVARANVSLAPAAGVRAGGAALQLAADLLAPALRAARRAPPPAADPPHAARPLALACVLLDYLQASGQEEVASTDKARELAALGYQRLMAYRRPDGSFAPETDENAKGDVWMTSVAARWLSRCSRYVAVEALAAKAAAAWLAQQQAADGSWPAPTAPVDPHAQAPLPLAAYAVIALHQAKGSDVLYKNNINKALDYLAKSLSPNLDAYSLAVIGGALAVARHPQLTQTLEIMDKYANNTGSTLFWSRTLAGAEWRNPWLRGNSLEAASAAWGLRAMLGARLVDEATPVVRYLLQAYSPDDPDPEVMDSLAQFAEAIKTSTKLRVSVNVSGSDDERQFQLGENKALIIQTQSIRNSRSVSAVTEGRGLALLGLSATGTTNVTAPWPRFTLDPRVDQLSTKHRLQLSVCFGFVAQGNDTESGLTLLTIQLPSGYLADIHTLNELTSARHVAAARLQQGGARIAAWVRAARAERCATLAAARALPVAAQRAGWATLLDLYDTSHRARVFFQPVAATACDVCRAWPSCSKACGAVAPQRADDAAAADGVGNAGTGGTAAPDHAHSAPASMVLALALIALTHLLR